MESVLRRLESAQIELVDIASELERVNDHIQYDPGRIDFINERISVGYKLLKKHGVRNTTELLQVKDDLHKRLQSVLNIDEEILQLQKEESKLAQAANELAELLYKKRLLQMIV